MNTPKIVTVVIQEEELTGTVKELALQLRKEYKLTQQQIGDLLGVTKACISYHLIRSGERGFLQNNRYEFLTKELFDLKSDEEISSDFDLPILTVARIRRLKNVNRKQITSLNRRRNTLALKMFDTKPGKNFKKFLSELHFESDLQRSLFNDFYLLGKSDTASKRVYRSRITDLISQKVSSMSRKELIQKEIINE